MAVVSFPIHQRIRGRVTNPTLAAGFSTVVICLAFVTPFTLMAMSVSKELEHTYNVLRREGLNGGLPRLWQAVGPPLAAIAAWSGMTEGEFREVLTTRLQEAGAFLLHQSLALLGALTGGVVKMLLALGSLFFLLRDGDSILAELLSVSPLGRDHTSALIKAVKQTILACFYGVAGVAVAQGTLCGLGTWLAGLGSPVLWGLAAAAVSVFPLFGSALVWIPASLILFAQGSVGSGIFLLCWGAALVGTVDNLVRPLVVTARLSIHPLLVFAALLGGVRAFGAIGILIGPVSLAVTAALLQIVRDKTRDAAEAQLSRAGI